MKVLFALSLLLSTLGLDIGLSRMLLNLGMTLPNSRTAETEGMATPDCYVKGSRTDERRGSRLHWASASYCSVL